MRKTVVLVVVLVLAAASVGALEIAIGAGGRYQLGFVTDFSSILLERETTAAIDLRATPYPLQLGVSFSRDYWGPFAAPLYVFENIGFTADWWFLDTPLGGLPLRFRLGAGVWASLPWVGFGARGTVGLSWTPVPSDKGFEIWLDLVPSIGGYPAELPPLPTPALEAGASAGLGLRYWFGR